MSSHHPHRLEALLHQAGPGPLHPPPDLVPARWLEQLSQAPQDKTPALPPCDSPMRSLRGARRTGRPALQSISPPSDCSGTAAGQVDKRS